MITVALEFSSPVRSAAILGQNATESEPALLGAAADAGDRGLTGLTLIDRALRQAAVDPDAVGRIVVGSGPGSYTGIRSAIALAQGWQLARGVKLLALGSTETLAAEAHALRWFGQVFVVIDAQRNELYFSGYSIDASGWNLIEPLRLAKIEEVEQLLGGGPELGERRESFSEALAVGPEVTRWFPRGKVLLPSAEMLGRLGSRRSDYLSGERLEPIYLREPGFKKALPPRVRFRKE